MKPHKNLLTLFSVILFATPQIFCMGEDVNSEDEWSDVEKDLSSEEQAKLKQAKRIQRLKQEINNHQYPTRKMIDPENSVKKFTFDRTTDTEQTPQKTLWNKAKDSALNIIHKRGLSTIFTKNANSDSDDNIILSEQQKIQFKNLDNADQQSLVNSWKLTHDQKTAHLLELAKSNYDRLMSDLKYGTHAKVFKEVANVESKIKTNNTEIDNLEKDLRKPKISDVDKTLKTTDIEILRKDNSLKRDSIQNKLEIINNQIKEYDTRFEDTINSILLKHTLKTQNFINFINSLNPKNTISITIPEPSTETATTPDVTPSTPTPPSTPRLEHSFSIPRTKSTSTFTPEDQDFKKTLQFFLDNPDDPTNESSVTEQTLSQLTDDLLAIKDLTLEKRQELTKLAEHMTPMILNDLIFKLWQKINQQGTEPEENSVYQIFDAVAKNKTNN